MSTKLDFTQASRPFVERENRQKIVPGRGGEKKTKGDFFFLSPEASKSQCIFK